MMPTVTLLVCFVSNMLGQTYYTVAKFNDTKSCETARVIYAEKIARNDITYACIEGVLH